MDDDVKDVDFFLRARNPVLLRAPNVSQTFDAFKIEGRFGAAATIEWSRRDHLSFGPERTRRVSLQWVATDDFRYLDPRLLRRRRYVELQLGNGVSNQSGRWQLERAELPRRRPRLQSGGSRRERATGSQPVLLGLTRGHGPPRSGPLGSDRRLGHTSAREWEARTPAKQRQIYLQGADPLEQLDNPFLRSRGSLLEGDDMHYQLPGGGGVRGIDPRVSTAAIVALNLELERTMVTRPRRASVPRVALRHFTDLAHGFEE